jgi:ATP-dependent Lon protease
VSLNYLQVIADLPWNTADPEQNNPTLAREVLERDHFGLEKVKKRII